MTKKIINFASDNTSGVEPGIFSSMTEAARSTSMPYGEDKYTEKLQVLANEIFEKEVRIYPVVTGSAANALALAAMSPAYGTVYCHEQSHIEEDECAAPEFYIGGGKLILLPGENAKLTANDLKEKLEVKSPAPPVHRSPPAVVSITQATEVGSIYTTDEISAISEVAHFHEITLHMDGARIANAIASLNKTPAEVTWKLGVDVLTLGATKNGAFAAEAVVFFDPEKVHDFEFRRKRGGHLLSKYRFLSSQLVPYLESEHWIELARNANLRASQLEQGLRNIAEISILYRVETNMIFLEMPLSFIDKFRKENCWFYTWGEKNGRVYARLVTSFDTSEADVKRFLCIACKEK